MKHSRKRIILCNDSGPLGSFLPPVPEPVSYLILEDTPSSLAVHDYLNKRGHSEELARAKLFRERSGSFRSQYVELLGRLNRERASRDWWAMPFTAKNPISSSLCRDMFLFLVAIEVSRQIERCLVIAVSQVDLARELQTRWEAEGLVVVNLVKSARSWTQTVMHLFPAAIMFLVFRSLWLRIRLGRASSTADSLEIPGDVMVTLVHPHSIDQNGRFCDTYFGELAEQLSRRRSFVTVLGIVQGQSVSLARAFQGDETGVVRRPLDSNLTASDILWAAWESMRAYLKAYSWMPRIEIAEVEVGRMVKRAIREAHASGEVFRSLYMFKCAQRLATNVKPRRCFYPCENRAWEKMLLLGVRSTSAQTKMIGYQHASITAGHMNYEFSEHEAAVTPLPDVIVTVGEITRDRLICGGFPAEILKVGCALRRSTRTTAGLKRTSTHAACRVLVALSGNVAEYIRVLSFLNEAIGSKNLFEVRIRPHPTLPLENALQAFPDGRAQFSYSVSTGSVNDDLQWADVVLYASSTLGLEAVGAGVPAVFLDSGEFVNTDPMHGWSGFKWVVQEPRELDAVLAVIKTLSRTEFELCQKEGRSFVDAYLAPITEEKLDMFCYA